MSTPSLRTSVGEIALHEYRLALGERTWSFLHTGGVLTLEEEQRYLANERDRMPYGVMLWPASIALAHEVAARDGLAGRRVLELGAGTGVPGIVAASMGARVLQTDRSDVALHVCAMNAERNRVGAAIERRVVDWESFSGDERFDVILGSDVLYATTMHARLRTICEEHLAPGGSVLFSDPFRAQSLPILEAMDAEGWRVTLAKWSIRIEAGERAIAVYELTRR